MKRKMWVAWVLAFGLGVLAVVHGAEAEREFKVYGVLRAGNLAVQEMVTTIVGAEGKLVVDARGSRFLVMALPEEHVAIAALLAELNKPGPNIRVVVTTDESGRSSGGSAGVTGHGGVVITEKGTTTHYRIQPHLSSRSSSQTGMTAQSIVMQSGTEGTLWVGQEVPYVDWLLERGRHWGYLTATTEFRRVGASLVAEATAVGDTGMIRLRVIPVLSGFADGRNQRIRFIEAATEMVVQSGVPTSLGGLDQHRAFYDRFLVGAAKGGQSRRINITVTATLDGK
jgi:hypothetical protein